MPPIVIPDAWQITVEGPLPGGERWANVFHAAVGTDLLTNVAADELNTRIRAAYNALPDLSFPLGYSIDRIVVRDIRQLGGQSLERLGTTAIGGSGDALPPQCAIVVTWLSAFSSRRGRGRTYLPGPSRSQIGSVGQMAPSTVADIITWGTAMYDAIRAAGVAAGGPTTWTLAIASRLDVLVRDVVSVTVNSVVDTQRRRSHDLVPITETNAPLGP